MHAAAGDAALRPPRRIHSPATWFPGGNYGSSQGAQILLLRGWVGGGPQVVDVEANRELAAALNVPAVILPRLAHDVMLDTRWREAAAELGRWLSALPPAAK